MALTAWSLSRCSMALKKGVALHFCASGLRVLKATYASEKGIPHSHRGTYERVSATSAAYTVSSEPQAHLEIVKIVNLFIDRTPGGLNPGPELL